MQCNWFVDHGWADLGRAEQWCLVGFGSLKANPVRCVHISPWPTMFDLVLRDRYSG